MNTKVKQLWIDALRSGRYQQGCGHLCKLDPDTGVQEFCALGVLCELANQHGNVKKTNGGDSIAYYGRAEHHVVPPDEVIEWAGMRYFNPVVEVVDARYSSSKCGVHMSTVNDELGFTFAEIADIIEENL
jgi:hypothetical protein